MYLTVKNFDYHALIEVSVSKLNMHMWIKLRFSLGPLPIVVCTLVKR